MQVTASTRSTSTLTLDKTPSSEDIRAALSEFLVELHPEHAYVLEPGDLRARQLDFIPEDPSSLIASLVRQARSRHLHNHYLLVDDSRSSALEPNILASVLYGTGHTLCGRALVLPMSI